LALAPHEPVASRTARQPSLLSEFTLDLTEAAAENQLDPLVERESLRKLREKYGIDEKAAGKVTREDIEAALARLVGIPVASIRQDFAGEQNESGLK